MKNHWLVISVAMFGTMFAMPARTQTAMTCAPTTEQQISGLFDRWNSSLATLNPDEVVGNYAPDAVLLPTVSNKPRTNKTEIRDYFVDFLQRKPQGVIDFRIIKIGCNIASDTGIYTFTLYNSKGQATKVQARYSFVYEYIDDQWLIEHHHSSVMPEPIVPTQAKPEK